MHRDRDFAMQNSMTHHTVVSKQIKTHPANMIDMRLPLFTQFNVLGTYDPSIAEPNTNNGNRDVNLDRISSTLDVVLSSSLEEVESSDDVEESNIIFPCLILFSWCLFFVSIC